MQVRNLYAQVWHRLQGLKGCGRGIERLVVLLSFCGWGCNSPIGEPLVPSSIIAVSPDSISGIAGTPVTHVPTVVVRDQFNAPLSGAEVLFAVVDGDGVVEAPRAVTDAQGRASPSSWILGPKVGANHLSASSGGLPVVVFAASSVPGAVAVLTRMSGTDGRSATVGTSVPLSPAVQVADRFDNPVPGVVVTFSVTGGGGAIEGATVLTDASGIAAVRNWILGTSAGPNTLLASAGDPPVTTVFSAMGSPDRPVSLGLHAGDQQAAYPGRSVLIPPAVIIHDRYGNGVPDVPVDFAVRRGRGSVTGAPASTLTTGVAALAAWTLGSQLTNTLVATAPGLDSVTFTAEGIIPNLAVTLEADQVATGATVRALAQVTDNGGSPVAGRHVVWGTSRPDRAIVDASGSVSAISPGWSCVTATVDGASRCANLLVGGSTASPPSPSLLIHIERDTLTVGSSVQASVKYMSETGVELPVDDIAWGSHNPGAVVVTTEGVVFAIREGTATVSATVSHISAQVYITVVR
ncbi:MAG: Ig-like domain-containing protein [Longimicrobiales bacterium]